MGGGGGRGRGEEGIKSETSPSEDALGWQGPSTKGHSSSQATPPKQIYEVPERLPLS